MTDIPLDRHAVVEASAGTGKTYTLEQVVLALLTSGRARLDQVLLVTYTEKAAGEMRARLRATLENALSTNPPVLQEALDAFDQASIYTIHGFCHRLLQEYAFENRQDFRFELVDDGEILEQCLRELQRKCWRQEFGAQLPAVLALAGYASSNTEIDRWEKKVRTLALRFRRTCGHQLAPAPDPDWLARLESATDAERGTLGAQLIVRTVQQLQDQLAVCKRERGLQSYEDLLTRVDEALDPASNPRAGHLLAVLRERYRYAIVDEFQDTDPIQWRIFRRIFVDGGSPAGDGAAPQRLIVVGDPKQAIFGFRGADLQAFLSARQELIQTHGALLHRLDTNWRSCPELLAPLNQLFGTGGWFTQPGLAYTPVEAPPAEKRTHALLNDQSGRQPLVLVDGAGAQRLVQFREQFARFIAAEIRRLLALQPALEFRGKEPLDRLGPDHIAILVYRRSEAKPIIAALRDAHIPYTFYKQPGLWQADEARHLDFLLRTLARPEQDQPFRRALLTRFYKVRPEQLALAEELPVNHPAHERFQHWRELAQQRRWSELFASLLDDTGILYREAGADDGERRLANYRHIIQTLEQRAYAQDLDLLGLLDLLAELRRRPDDQDSGLQPIETDRAKVRIMTIHAAKGLEFPVVFLAGGFTGKTTTDVCSYRNADGNVVFDLLPDDEAKQRAKDERAAEDRRLLYVALTRAMFKLYVPSLDPKRSYRGAKGPTAAILAEAIAESRLADGAHVETVKPDSVPVPAAAPFPPPTTSAEPVIEIGADWCPRLDPDLARRRIFIRSFSSLHRGSARLTAKEEDAADWPARADDDLPDTLAEQPLLRGPVFGDLVHTVIDGIDFAAVARAAEPAELLRAGLPSQALIDQELAYRLAELAPRGVPEQLAEAGRQLVARLVWQGLRTPLPGLGPLAEVPPQDRLHELEFHFPEQADGVTIRPLSPVLGGEGRGEGGIVARTDSDSLTPVPSPPSTGERGQRLPGGKSGPHEGFLTGFMDLVVRRQDKLFLFDWKTNDLAGYAPAELQQNMLDCEYDRQYRLYLQALVRWLQRVRGRDVDLERDLGGVYYLYLRGMNGKDESSGVFFARPTPADLQLARVLGD